MLEELCNTQQNCFILCYQSAYTINVENRLINASEVVSLIMKV
jgi:hypothetical protein